MANRSVILVKRVYLHIGIITLASAVLWTMLSIYNALVSSPEVKIDPDVLTPINASFDEESFLNIIGREDLGQLSFEEPVEATETASVAEVIVVAETETEDASVSAQVLEENDP